MYEVQLRILHLHEQWFSDFNDFLLLYLLFLYDINSNPCELCNIIVSVSYFFKHEIGLNDDILND